VGHDILTPRLRLRPWREADLSELLELFATPEVWHFPLRRGFTNDETRSFLSRMMEQHDAGIPCPFAAEDRRSSQLVGYIGLSVPHFLPEVMPSVEIGWRLGPIHWGQGLATEGARAVLAYAFETLELDELISIYEPSNESSGRVMQRIGMRFDRDTTYPDGGPPLRIYRLTRHAWVLGAPSDVEHQCRGVEAESS